MKGNVTNTRVKYAKAAAEGEEEKSQTLVQRKTLGA
jgi:hypothetical protein